MISYHNGIALSKRGVAFLSMGSGNPDVKSPAEPLQKEDENSTTDWAKWGQDNLLPNQMLADIEACGVLAAAIDGKARFGLGRGIKPFKIISVNKDGSEELQPVNNPEIDDFLEENDIFSSCFGWFKDQIGFANYVARFKFNNSGDKIGLVFRDDVTQMRYRKADENGIIKSVFISTFWDRQLTSMQRGKTHLEIDLLPTIGPATYLQNIAPENRKAKEYALAGRTPAWNRNYYSMPTWWAAKKWVEIAKNVPDMKAHIFENNIRIKYIVTIYDSYWVKQYGEKWMNYTADQQQEKREELYTSIDNWLTGSDNAYKSIFIPGTWDAIAGKGFTDIEIKPVEDHTKEGELLPDSAAANSEILFALMMNPALMGADTPGGPYSGGAGSGSNIREAALVQVMIQEFERQQISRILNIVKKINKWDPDIVWRFPGLVLTTLDTGKSTKEVTTGG